MDLAITWELHCWKATEPYSSEPFDFTVFVNALSPSCCYISNHQVSRFNSLTGPPLTNQLTNSLWHLLIGMTSFFRSSIYMEENIGPKQIYYHRVAYSISRHLLFIHSGASYRAHIAG